MSHARGAATAAIAAVVLAGCGSAPAVEQPTQGSGSGAMTRMSGTKASQATFERGVALSPADKLVAWMDAQQLDGKPRLLRLPLVLPQGTIGFDIAKARIGTAADALEVYANDGALGIGLADRAVKACGEAASCAFRVEGYWRGKQLGGLQFDVMKAEPLPPDQLAGATFAEVEGESGN